MLVSMARRSRLRPAAALFRQYPVHLIAVLAGVLSTAGFALLSPPAQSTPEYMGQFNDRYGTRGSRLDSCMTCHTSESGGAQNMNPYGADFGKHGHDFGGIESLDSDGDGFTNVDEIRAGTFPGDRSEDPDHKPAPKPKPSTTTTTTAPFPFSLLPKLPPGAAGP